MYTDEQAFSDKVDAYFDQCEVDKKSATLAGLSYFMGFADKQSFGEYENYSDVFSLTVKRARLRMEADRHERVISKDSFTPGLIFDLKNNHGWKDKTEQELTGLDGGPIKTETILGVDPSQFSAAFLQELAAKKVE